MWLDGNNKHLQSLLAHNLLIVAFWIKQTKNKTALIAKAVYFTPFVVVSAEKFN